ncbi:MAG: glutamine--fructose-6-phosphate transaminase (isomerizing) [Coprothermobacterota bacterium]|nr:glutamine--fructose-6-phosphate transaminase (isomerizing) [Coprothermobacterota bacterium]
MCGIFGIVFQKEREDLGRIMVQAAYNLTYRGYDSVGCAAISADGRIDLRKDIGKVEEVDDKYGFSGMRGIRGLVQLRWATFGVPAQRNSQPHLDCDGDLVGAHNGNVINTISLHEQFLEEGHTIRGENDGEIVVHAVERHFDRLGDLPGAIMAAVGDLKGDYAYVISHQAENAIYAVKMGSSLYLGVGEGFVCVSSDLPSILELTPNIVTIRDGEFLRLGWDQYQLFNIRSGQAIERRPERSPHTKESAHKGGHSHFMIKEIREQPEKVANLLHFLEESAELPRFTEALRKAGRLFLVGSGTSYHACLVGSYYFNKLAGLAAIPVPAGAMVEQYGDSLRSDDVLLCVSQSGETKDVINVLNYCEARLLGQVLAFVNVLGSTLSLRSRHFLPLVCDLEISVPATKTFTNQLVLFLAIANALAGGGKVNLPAIPGLIEDTLAQTEPRIRQLAQELLLVNDFYFLGYGLTHGIAYEGALKTKEVVYNHCEGAYSSEFKHGPLAIVYPGYPVIFISTVEDAEMVSSHINEVSCRLGRVITVAPPHSLLEKYSSDFIALPVEDYFHVPIAATIPLQLLAYYMSVGRGIDPDFPRNISKTLTVD